MKKSVKMFRQTVILLGLGVGLAGSAAAAPMVNLAGQLYVQYGDAQSYSLPTAALACPQQNNCQFNVKSTPGDIKDLIVMATGASGTGVTTNASGMDNAYSTPSGNGGAPYFSTTVSPNNGTNGAVANNGANTWDASLSALKGFLLTDQMVFMFNNNQTNQFDGATQSLAGWAMVWITDGAGKTVGLWELSNMGGKYNLFTQGGGGNFMGDVTTYASDGSGPLAGTNNNTDYVLSGGAICYLLGAPVSCDTPGAGQPVNHNLGADQVAYAILFPEMNAMMDTLFGSLSDAELGQYTFHADVRLGCDAATVAGNCTGSDTVKYGRDLDNGFEQLFIGRAARQGCRPGDPACNPVDVAEPGSLALMALALAVLGLFRRQRQGV